jgi:hypothetical protein
MNVILFVWEYPGFDISLLCLLKTGCIRNFIS